MAQFWHDETGQEIIKRSAGDWLIRDDERPYLQVSPDRTYWLTGQPHSAQNKGILECKTTQLSIDEDDIPKHWFCQVQYQLGVAGLTQGSLAWLCSGREFGYKNLAFVPDFYLWLVEEVDKFWKDNIIGGVEPEATDVQDVLLKFNRHTDGKILEVSESVKTACQDLKKVKEEIDALTARKEELEAQIKLGFGDAEAISFEGQTLATWKAPKPTKKFDAKAFQAENEKLCEPYMRETQGARRFLLK